MRGCADFIRQDKADAGKGYGAFSMWRSFAWICGLYDPFQKLAGAGAGVPLPGFGNVLWQGVKEAVDKYGFMGVFMGGFQASAVGISAALIFGYIASFIFEPKMKK